MFDEMQRDCDFMVTITEQGSPKSTNVNSQWYYYLLPHI